MHAGTQIPKLCATDSLEAVRLLSPLPRGDRGAARHARLLHDPGRERHGGARRRTEKLAKLRKGVMELYISDHPLDLPHLRGQRRLRAAGHGRHRSACATCATATRATTTSRRPRTNTWPKDDVEPVLHLRPVEMHRLQPLRAGLRRGAGHLRADHRGQRLRQPCGCGPDRISSSPSASPAGPACRPAPRRRLQEKSIHRAYGQPDHSRR